MVRYQGTSKVRNNGISPFGPVDESEYIRCWKLLSSGGGMGISVTVLSLARGSQHSRHVLSVGGFGRPEGENGSQHAGQLSGS